MRIGRPLKYSSVQEVQGLIDTYFATTPKEEWTITGLALALDTSRQTLVNYENRADNPEFFDAIRKAKDMVENSYELDLKKSGRTGTIFALKNFEWTDKNETELSNPDGNLKTIIIQKNVTDFDDKPTA